MVQAEYPVNKVEAVVVPVFRQEIDVLAMLSGIFARYEEIVKAPAETREICWDLKGFASFALGGIDSIPPSVC